MTSCPSPGTEVTIASRGGLAVSRNVNSSAKREQRWPPHRAGLLPWLGGIARLKAEQLARLSQGGLAFECPDRLEFVVGFLAGDGRSVTEGTIGGFHDDDAAQDIQIHALTQVTCPLQLV